MGSLEKKGFKEMNVMKILTDLGLEDKLNIVFNYNHVIARKWHQEYEQNRVNNIPHIICRICDREFYADKCELHNVNCLKKSSKIKE